MAKTKVEGIVLSKTPFQDRHVISRLLLRNGEKLSVLFYGGQGGGKKNKVTGLEVGHLLKVELTSAKPNQGLVKAKEWSVGWGHDQIRLSHQAFYSLCFYLELIDKVSVDTNFSLYDSEEQDSGQGSFIVLSNAQYYLEQALKDGNISFWGQRFTFLAKLLIELGVFPELSECLLTGDSLTACPNILLSSDHGGFVNMSVLPIEQRGQNDHDLWRFLHKVALSKYQDLQDLVLDDTHCFHKLFNFFCYQFQFEKNHFRSYGLLT